LGQKNIRQRSKIANLESVSKQEVKLVNYLKGIYNIMTDNKIKTNKLNVNNNLKGGVNND